jgi:hypothetical protein
VRPAAGEGAVGDGRGRAACGGKGTRPAAGEGASGGGRGRTSAAGGGMSGGGEAARPAAGDGAWPAAGRGRNAFRRPVERGTRWGSVDMVGGWGRRVGFFFRYDWFGSVLDRAHYRMDWL